MTAAVTAVASEPDTVRIRTAGSADDLSWDRFVSQHEAATFFHRAAWRRLIAEVFGHRSHYLIAEGAAGFRGILPLVEMRSRLFGHALVSTPFCVEGGIVAADEQARTALAAAARDLADNLSVDFLELRNREALDGEWLGKDLYVSFRKEISADDDENLREIPRKQRAMVRKGIKGPLVSRIDPDVASLYPCYAESVRNLGTPVFARAWFERLLAAFPGESDVLTVTQEGSAMASVLSFYFRDEVLPYYGGGIAAARGLYANDFLYWELMRHAAQRGVRCFDYGRSKRDSGSYRFKKHWGFEPQSLHYQYHLVRATGMPDLSPANPKYRLLIGAWKRLPLPIACTVGPWISRYLG